MDVLNVKLHKQETFLEHWELIFTYQIEKLWLHVNVYEGKESKYSYALLMGIYIKSSIEGNSGIACEISKVHIL